MNTKNIRALADLIETLEHDNEFYPEGGVTPYGHFTMAYLRYDCGTPACIAGWACAKSRDTEKIPVTANVEREAAEWLGLDYHWAYRKLFFPQGGGYYSHGGLYTDIPPAQAARVLRAVADAGENYKNLDMVKVWKEAETELAKTA